MDDLQHILLCLGLPIIWQGVIIITPENTTTGAYTMHPMYNFMLLGANSIFCFKQLIFIYFNCNIQFYGFCRSDTSIIYTHMHIYSTFLEFSSNDWYSVIDKCSDWNFTNYCLWHFIFMFMVWYILNQTIQTPIYHSLSILWFIPKEATPFLICQMRMDFINAVHD